MQRLKAWKALQKSDSLLKQELRQQLAKDLALRLEELPNEGLLNWLKDWLGQRQDEPALLQCLYRVDLPENLDFSSAEDWAWAILEREAQKVLFRAQMRGDLQK